MSRNIKNSIPIQKYCKVCHDAGKSESEYRSHFIRETREPNSRVTCPTLLSQECRFCYKKGHTIKYCTTLLKKNSVSKPICSEASKKVMEEPKSKKVVEKNIFTCLDDSDSEEDNTENLMQNDEEFPELVDSKICKYTRTPPMAVNYVEALSKPTPVKQCVSSVPLPQNLTKSAPWASGTAKLPMKSWADWDTDSEDEEDIYNPLYHTKSSAKAEMTEDW